MKNGFKTIYSVNDGQGSALEIRITPSRVHMVSVVEGEDQETLYDMPRTAANTATLRAYADDMLADHIA